MTNKNEGQYCHKCVHAREKVIPRCWICKLNCVQRNQTDICLWDSKNNPSKFEPLSEDANEQELALSLARDIPLCRDCGDLIICDGDCQFKSRTEQIKANERNEVLDKLTHKLIEEMIIDGTTEFVTFQRHAISNAINSLRNGVP